MAKLKNVMPKIIIDGAIFNSLSTETLAEVGLTAYQLGLEWFKRSGEKSVNSLVEYFTKDGEITEDGTKILGQMFADKYSKTIHDIYKTLSIEYNPLQNYNIESTDTEKSKGNSSSSNSGSSSSNGNSTHNVSAFDSSGYQPEDQTITSGSDSSSSNGSMESTGESTKTHIIHGNYGFTTSQDLINAELKLRNQTMIVDNILKWCDEEFCLKIYE